MSRIAYLTTLLFFVGGFLVLDAQPTYFKVTVENVGEAFPFSQSDVFNTPVGATDPGPLFPGDAYEFSFDAAPGSYLTIATMFVQSNDLFYAPEESGIALYDDMGNPTEGDLTSELLLWDAGTEENQVPGEGADQAPRQDGPNEGADDPDNTVRLVDDGYSYPPAAGVINFTLTHNGGTSFSARIENVSTGMTLELPDGSTVPVPLSPGVYVVHSAPAPLFTAGEPDREEGLEGIAEDGAAGQLLEAVQAHTGATPVLSPGVSVVHGGDDPLFTVGESDREEGLEAIAEDGMAGMLSAVLRDSEENTGCAFAVPVGATGPGPVGPGGSYEFIIASGSSGKLSLATMYVQSNDLFYAPDGMGIPLFDSNGAPISGDITEYIALWDAGTELNEIPGVGLNQAPRQSGPDTGEADPDNTVRLVDDGYFYPADEEVIRVTITPLETTTFTVRVENLSDGNTIPTGDGESVAVPLSPGAWALHSCPAPLFTNGAPDRGWGLEGIAEDGNPSMLNMTLGGKMGTPSGAFNTPVGADDPAPIFPGEAYEFTVVAAPGVNLSMATMFVQSNDLFYAPGEMGVPLFDDNGDPISGDITEYFDLWDAGTEENQQPGVGDNQAPRQSGPDVGPADPDNTVRLVNDGFSYPPDEEVIRVTINPETSMGGTARLQVIHAASFQTVDVVVNGETLLSSVAYKTATPYLDVPAGTPLNIELVPVGGPTPASQTTAVEIELEDGETYVAAAYGTFDDSDDQNVQVALFSPAMETADNGSVALSFFSGAYDVASAEVMQGGSTLFGNTTYGSFADYQSFPADVYEITIVDGGGTELGTYEGSFGFWNRKSAVIFTTGSTEQGNFQPWVALSNGGTYPLSEVTPFAGNDTPDGLTNPNSTVTVSGLSVYPNPASAITTLQYELPQTTQVNIQLRDLTGQVIKNVFQGNADAGIHRLTEDISTLPKGMYFYSIATGEQVQTLRLVVQ